VGSGEHDETVGMGALRIGKDFESDIQYFDGEEVERITTVMG
jgi:hypothetical protein